MERVRPCGGERAPLGEGAPLWGRARPSGGGRAPLGEGMFTLTWLGE